MCIKIIYAYARVHFVYMHEYAHKKMNEMTKSLQTPFVCERCRISGRIYGLSRTLSRLTTDASAILEPKDVYIIRMQPHAIVFVNDFHSARQQNLNVSDDKGYFFLCLLSDYPARELRINPFSSYICY